MSFFFSGSGIAIIAVLLVFVLAANYALREIFEDRLNAKDRAKRAQERHDKIFHGSLPPKRKQGQKDLSSSAEPLHWVLYRTDNRS